MLESKVKNTGMHAAYIASELMVVRKMEFYV